MTNTAKKSEELKAKLRLTEATDQLSGTATVSPAPASPQPAYLKG